MAVKTSFSNKTLKRIISDYNVGEFIESKHFKQGYVQTNILIITTQGKFVLRYYENRPRKRAAFEAKLLEYLQIHNYPCPKPIKDTNARTVKTHRNKPYVLFSYVKGRHLKNLNDKQLKEMTKHLALLHRITEDYKPENYEQTEPRTKNYCLKAALTEARRFKDKEQGRKRLDRIKTKLNQIQIPKNLPKGIIHGDFDKSNIKFIGDKVTGIIDFDDTTHTFLIYDLGVIILYWARFYQKGFNLETARKIVKTYEKYRPLSKIEKQHLFDATQFHALMIMAWLMNDKWKGRDIYQTLSKIIEELDTIGRKQFYKKIFG